MKKNFYLFLALLLFAGAVHAQLLSKTYITLVNDDSVVANYEELNAYLVPSVENIVISFSGQGYMPVTIIGKDNKTFFDKELYGANSHILQLRFLDIPSGEYTLNIFWNNCWWRGDFLFKSHKPEGQYVYIDSTYYRLNKGTAVTIEPEPWINGRTRSMRMHYPCFDRDYPLHVVVPSELPYEGKTYQVTGVEGGSFQYCHYLLSIDLPNTITSIGDCAFGDCVMLQRVDIPENVTELGFGVFSGCERLSSIVIPEGITAIKTETFLKCRNLSSVTLPSSLTSIDGWAFWGCENLIEMKLPKNLRRIDQYAFCRCLLLTRIEIPDGVISIGEDAFTGIPDDAHIYCYAKNPCEIKNNTFNYNCTLHVPKGSKQKYEKAAYWNNFTFIEEMTEEVVDENEIPEVNSDETGVSPAVWSEDIESAEQFYDLQGRPVDGTQKGIYIQNGKKVLVK